MGVKVLVMMLLVCVSVLAWTFLFITFTLYFVVSCKKCRDLCVCVAYTSHQYVYQVL